MNEEKITRYFMMKIIENIDKVLYDMKELKVDEDNKRYLLDDHTKKHLYDIKFFAEMILEK